MRLRTCWTRIAKRTMRYLAAITVLFLILALPHYASASPAVTSRFKRSMDLNELEYHRILHRLPQEVVATSYHLELQPFVGNDKFNGRVRINVTWTDTSDTITLNADPDIHISKYSVRITEAASEEREKGLPMMDVNVARVTLPDWQKPWYTIHLEQMLKKGSSCEVDISFVGNLTSNVHCGLYRKEYPDHPYVATYFRPNRAHQVFPCMDEPPYKATFKLSVLRPVNMTALSNTPLELTAASDNQNFVWDHFETTPKMSTYQLALLVSDFTSISPNEEINEMDGRRVEIKVWAPKKHLDSLEHVPDKIVWIMNYLQEYFNSSIVLPKLDIVALPWLHDNPTDNWGLMFFGTNHLNSPSIWTVTYELIYQWIGQYITPFSWSDAPVSKALNSFLASMTTVDINPDEMEGRWPMTMLYSFYYEFGKYKPFSKAAGITNEATASKTELVFRMFNILLGKEMFRKGVRNFIRQNSEENLRTFFADDIYSHLNDIANETNILPEGRTVSSIAGLWITRDRLPLVTVIRDYETKTMTLSQKVNLREAPRAATPKVSYQWDIPIVMMSEEKLEFHKPYPLWLPKGYKPKNLTVPDITDEDHFIIVNPEEIGMFPVNYDSCNWKMLIQYLRGPNREKIPVLTRAKLLHDSWNLAYSGELCFGIALNMTLFLQEERCHVVWEPIFMMIDHIDRRIEGSEVYPKFQAYIRTLLKPLYMELKENEQAGEPSWKSRMRGMAKNFLCRAGYEPCIIEARNQYQRWLRGEDQDARNSANDFICPLLKWGTEEEWEFGLQRIMNVSKYERMDLKSLAGCTKDANKIERLLNVTILEQNENFSDSDIQLIFVTLSGGAAGYRTLFNFLIDNWDTVKQRFEDKHYLWSSIIELATSTYSTQQGVDLVEKLYESHRDHVSKNLPIQKAFTADRKQWTEKNLPVIDAWLSENLPKEELEATQSSTATTMVMPVKHLNILLNHLKL